MYLVNLMFGLFEEYFFLLTLKFSNFVKLFKVIKWVIKVSFSIRRHAFIQGNGSRVIYTPASLTTFTAAFNATGGGITLQH